MQIWGDIEFEWALKQLEVIHLINRRGDEVCLTDAGLTKAIDIEQTLSLNDRIILMLHYSDIKNTEQ